MNTYIAKRTDAPLSLADPRWQEIPFAEHAFRWADSSPSPYKSGFRLIHSPEGVTVRLESNEWPLRAVRTVCNEQICEDSCMEFFFTPNEEEKSYINIEVNPLGVTHIGFGEGRHGRRLLDITGEGLAIETAIRFGEGWCACLFIPYTFIEKQFASHTAAWRMNSYKCGDLTPIEHYAVWNPIEVPKPDYHRPEFFGSLILG